MRHEIEDGFDPLQCSLGEWYSWTEYARPKRRTPQKILVPLDQSITGAEQVLSVAQGLLGADGEGILLRVIPSPSTKLTRPLNASLATDVTSRFSISAREATRSLSATAA